MNNNGKGKEELPGLEESLSVSAEIIAARIAAVGPQELGDERRMRIQEGILAAHEIEHERDRLRTQLAAEILKNRGLAAEHEALKASYGRLQTEIEDYRRERDQAVARRAEVEAVFAAALTIMQTHKGETVLSETEKKGE
jgi:hypothetical protein